MLSILGSLDTTEAVTEVQFSDGRIVRLPTAMLEPEQVPVSLEARSMEEATSQQDTMSLPLVEEQLEIQKRTVATAKIRLEKTVEAYDVTVDDPLAVSSWKVERIALGQVIEAVPSVREEGLVTIYPVVEERMVLTKELVLVEEIRITREASERQSPQTFTLRRERVNIEREELAAS